MSTDKKIHGSQWIVSFGSPFSGMEVFGPFPSSEDAIEFAERYREYDSWEIAELKHPSHLESAVQPQPMES